MFGFRGQKPTISEFYTCNLSRYWGWPCPFFIVPVSSKSRSASVDFPWSTWAIIEKFRILSGGYWLKSTMLSLLLWREWEHKALLQQKWCQLSGPLIGLHPETGENGLKAKDRCRNKVDKYLGDLRALEALFR